MTINQALDIVKKQAVPASESQKEARNVFYAVTLHTKGARPKFFDLSSTNPQGVIIPPGYLGEEYQNIFDKFLLSKHPREEQVTRMWRYSQYKPLTKIPFQQLITLIRGLIYQDSNMILKMDDQNIQEFLNRRNFEASNTFISFFKNIVSQLLIEDPNGYLVIMPSKPRTETINDINPLDISIQYVRVIDILHDDETDLIYKSRDGKYCFWINDTDIIRFSKQTQGDKKDEWTNEEGYFSHKFNRIPAIKLGGIFADGYYKSYIDNAIPVADEFISTYSSEQLIDKEVSHPYIQQASIDCPTCNAVGYTQDVVEKCDMYPNGTMQVPCKTCNGKKQISFNPGDRYEVPVHDMDKQMVKIINPDVSVNTYHHNKNQDIYKQILDALHLLKIDESQSGIAKTIDRDNLYQFCRTICDRLFELKAFCLKCIVAYRSPNPSFDEKDKFTLSKPHKFDTQTADELLTDISTAKAGNVPVHVRSYMINEFVEKRYKGDDAAIKINQIYAALDKTFALSFDEIKSAKEIGLISDEDIQNSIQIRKAVENIVTEKTSDYIRSQSLNEIINEVKKQIQ